MGLFCLRKSGCQEKSPFRWFEWYCTAKEEVEEALKGEDKDAIEAASTKLTEASSSLAQKMYAEQSAEQGGEAPQSEAGNDESAGGDDVVDAEFEEVKEDSK